MSTNFAAKMMRTISDAIKASEDPANRVVSKVYFEPTDRGTVNVLVDSADKDGFAADEGKFLLETCQLVTETQQLEFLAAFDDPWIGGYDIEEEIIRRFGNQFAELRVGMEMLETSLTKDVTYFHEDKSPLLDYLDEIACGLFITGTGQPNYGNICEAEKYGLVVFPGDHDSFGWLTGCIQKRGSEHILVFG